MALTFTPIMVIVSHGQTLFCTEGKGLGHWHRATCSPAMTSHGGLANDRKVRLAIFLHPRFWVCCVPADVSRHFSLSAHFSRFRYALYSNWNFEYSN